MEDKCTMASTSSNVAGPINNKTVANNLANKPKQYVFKGKVLKKSQYYALRKRQQQLKAEQSRPSRQLWANQRVSLDLLQDKVKSWLEDKQPTGVSNINSTEDANIADSPRNPSPLPQLTGDNLPLSSTWLTDDISFDDHQSNDNPVVNCYDMSTIFSSASHQGPVDYRALQPSTSAPKMTTFQRHLHELHTIFTVHSATFQLQNSILQFMKKFFPPNVGEKFPVDCRSLRPPTIQHTTRIVPPGVLTYFGIANVLRMPGITLFDKNVNEIRFSMNIDGLPLCRHANGQEFHPLLGSVDQLPVFLIGLYEGRKKPLCPNDYLKEFVAEVKELQQNGLTIDNVVYRFVFVKIVMDAPMLSYITGVKGHTGYHGCSKCRVVGTPVVLTSSARTKAGNHRKAVRYLDLDAEPRQKADFEEHYHWSNDPHQHASNGTAVYNEDDLSEEDEDNNLWKSYANEEIVKHHQHPSSLVTIDGFDIVRDIPLDYMHLVCIGTMKRLLNMWVLAGPYKMRPNCIEIISNRLIAARSYFPAEFQRKSESLQCLSTWKATQLRSFLLYIGVVVLDGILDEAYLSHFHMLVIAMRILTCRIEKQENYKNILKLRGNIAKQWIRLFIEKGIELYSGSFAVYNIHNLIHMPDDYIRFGPVDQYSAFKYESFLGRLKRLVTGNCKPIVQVTNKYSSLLSTCQFGKEGNRAIDSLEEYYETPCLLYKYLPQHEEQQDNHTERGRPSNEHSVYDHFKRMRFKSFVLSTDNECDSYCVIDGDYYKISKILQNRETKSIYVVGRYFQNTRSLFHSPYINNTASRSIGIVIVSELTSRYHTHYYGNVNEKCFALPYSTLMATHPDNVKNTSKEWVMIRYLH